jgi:tetratricopeptide (TPR) repeat protein
VYKHGSEYPLRRVLVVERDDATLVQAHLTEFLPDAVVKYAKNSNQALELCQRDHFDIVICSWRLEPVSALGLVNKLRSSYEYSLTPIVTIAAQTETREAKLVEEFPVTRTVLRPCTGQAFMQGINKVVSDLLWYRGNTSKVNRLIESAYQEPTKFIGVVDECLKDGSPSLALLLARQSQGFGFYSEAEMIYKRILDQDNACVQALGGLGRLCYLQGKPKDAAVYLRIAHNVSGGDLERLCMLGEVELSQLETKEAAERFREVLKYDPEHAKAQAGITLATNIEEFVAQYAMGDQLRSFASIANAVGVFLVRDGDVGKGIEQYKAACQFLRDEETRGRVYFNIGLGFLRWSRPEEALKWFYQAMQAGPRTRDKASHYAFATETRLKSRSGAPANDSRSVDELFDDSEMDLFDLAS